MRDLLLATHVEDGVWGGATATAAAAATAADVVSKNCFCMLSLGAPTIGSSWSTARLSDGSWWSAGGGGGGGGGGNGGN